MDKTIQAYDPASAASSVKSGGSAPGICCH